MTLSDLSRQRLATCHPDLVRIVTIASARFPFEVLCGHRNEADQEAACAAGRSHEHWPNSRHNSDPAEAVDLAPLPIDWENTARFTALAVVMKQSAEDLGLEIVWGGEWVTFKDLPHYELPKKGP